MAGTTSPRNYPYPTDGDAINTAGHIQGLAEAVDNDVQVVATTINPAVAAALAAQQADYIARDGANVVHGYIASGPGYHQTSGIAFQGGWAAVTLDGFSHAQIDYVTPFVIDPIVIVSGGSPANPQVATTGLFVENPNTLSALHVVAHAYDGGPLADAILAFYWLAIGFVA